MSREIDLTKPLSDDDREYLLQRNRLHDIAVADAGAEEEVTPPLPPAVEGVPSLVDQSPQQEPASALGQERDREAALEPERQEGDGAEGDGADEEEGEADEKSDEQSDDSGAGGSDPASVVGQPTVTQTDSAPDGEGKPVTDGAVSAAAADDEADNYDDKEAWSYRDLQDEARKRDLATGGDRAEIIARLREDDSKES